MSRIKYVLYVFGETGLALSAEKNVRKILEDRSATNEGLEIVLEVVDLKQNPALAREQRIMATPALIRPDWEPRQILIGDFSESNKLRTFLGL